MVGLHADAGSDRRFRRLIRLAQAGRCFEGIRLWLDGVTQVCGRHFVTRYQLPDCRLQPCTLHPRRGMNLANGTTARLVMPFSGLMKAIRAVSIDRRG